MPSNSSNSSNSSDLPDTITGADLVPLSVAIRDGEQWDKIHERAKQLKHAKLTSSDANTVRALTMPRACLVRSLEQADKELRIIEEKVAQSLSK